MQLQSPESVSELVVPPPAVRPADVLLLPGLDNSGPGHWQSRWETHPGFARVDFGDWVQPRLHEWIPRLDRAIEASEAPVVLAAHSLGCLAVVWWAALSWRQSLRGKLQGALLVAPPDVDVESTPGRIRDFRPVPALRLPFPSVLVASRDDPFARFDRAREMARSWGSTLIDAGEAGHINADSGLGDWSCGLRILSSLSGHDANRLVAGLDDPAKKLGGPYCQPKE